MLTDCCQVLLVLVIVLVDGLATRVGMSGWAKKKNQKKKKTRCYDYFFWKFSRLYLLKKKNNNEFIPSSQRFVTFASFFLKGNRVHIWNIRIMGCLVNGWNWFDATISWFEWIENLSPYLSLLSPAACNLIYSIYYFNQPNEIYSCHYPKQLCFATTPPAWNK